MHRLVRQVRFSVNPFSDTQPEGANSFASKPTGEGLSLYLQLEVGLAGQADKDTGFVVNVVEIDGKVRELGVPVIVERVKDAYSKGGDIGFGELSGLLTGVKDVLKGGFENVLVSDLTLRLNPFRKISIDCEADKMVYFSEKFEFAAMHKLWNRDFSDKKNFEIFGKCANPSGHGHNYVIEVTVKAEEGQNKFSYGEFEKVVDDEFVQEVDHKNLNEDTGFFKENIPTVENIAVFAWEKLTGKFPNVKLHSVTIWETDRTSCTYYG